MFYYHICSIYSIYFIKNAFLNYFCRLLGLLVAFSFCRDFSMLGSVEAVYSSSPESPSSSRSSPPPILRTPLSAFDFFALFYYLILFMATLHHLYARSCGSVASLGSYLCPSFIPLIASYTVFLIDSHLRVLDPSN